MAQTNFTPILLYGSSTPGNVPLAANLTNSATGSEIAINVADKNLFFKDSGGTVNTVPIRQSSTSSNGWLSATDWDTFNNKGSGTVTSVAATVPAFLSIAGSPITTSGTLAITLSGTALPVANGGTGTTTTPSNGQIPIGNGTNYTAATLTAGSGISVTNASGSITIANTQNTGPAFSAYANTSQTVTVNTFTKVVLNNETFDTNNNFDSTTNYRFTPTVAGYYQFNAILHIEGTVTTTQFIIIIAKNGVTNPRLLDINPSTALGANGEGTFSASAPLIYMNGSTDYVELYGFYSGGTATFSGTTASYQYSYLSGSLIRGA